MKDNDKDGLSVNGVDRSTVLSIVDTGKQIVKTVTQNPIAAATGGAAAAGGVAALLGAYYAISGRRREDDDSATLINRGGDGLEGGLENGSTGSPTGEPAIVGEGTGTPQPDQVTIGGNTTAPEGMKEREGNSDTEDLPDDEDWLEEDFYVQENVELLQNYYYATTEVQAKELLQKMIEKDPDNENLYQEKLEEAIAAWHNIPTYEERMEKLGRPAESKMEDRFGIKEPSIEEATQEILNNELFTVNKNIENILDSLEIAIAELESQKMDDNSNKDNVYIGSNYGTAKAKFDEYFWNGHITDRDNKKLKSFILKISTDLTTYQKNVLLNHIKDTYKNWKNAKEDKTKTIKEKILDLNKKLRDHNSNFRYAKVNGKTKLVTLQSIYDEWYGLIQNDLNIKRENITKQIDELNKDRKKNLQKISILEKRLINLQTNFYIEAISKKFKDLEGFDINPDIIKAICLQESGGSFIPGKPFKSAFSGTGYHQELTPPKNSMLSLRIENKQINLDDPNISKRFRKHAEEIFKKYPTTSKLEDNNKKLKELFEGPPEATSIEKEAVLKYTSMGISHILGMNAKEVGFKSALDMYNTFKNKSNENSLKQVIATYNYALNHNKEGRKNFLDLTEEIKKNPNSNILRSNNFHNAMKVWNRYEDYPNLVAEHYNKVVDSTKKHYFQSE